MYSTYGPPAEKRCSIVILLLMENGPIRAIINR
jgi:hypothetical protein